MKKGTKWIYMIVGGLLATGLVAGTAFVFLRSEAAGQRSLTNSTMNMTGPSAGWLIDGDRPMGRYEEALADALGISVEELQAAYDVIWKARIATAIDEGKLSEDQGKQLLERGGFAMRGRRGPIGIGVESNALLADKLGISVSTLEAAQEKAHETLIAKALESGELSEEQVEMMQARNSLAPYLQETMADAFENAVDQALSEGAITQTQADLLLENGGPGMQGEGKIPGGPGMRGRGGFFPGGGFFRTDQN